MRSTTLYCFACGGVVEVGLFAAMCAALKNRKFRFFCVALLPMFLL